ncbi:MAG: hypothetical protein KDK78_07420, partial [Chlamydiia bacterium]|nr:hypothetical protein [Chlamydiia bacterium]
MYGIESIRPRRPITLPELPLEEEVSKGPSRLYTQSALDACVQFTARSVLILRPEQSLALISMRNLRMASLISSAGWRYLTAGVLGLAISPVQEGARLFVC